MWLKKMPHSPQPEYLPGSRKPDNLNLEWHKATAFKDTQVKARFEGHTRPFGWCPPGAATLPINIKKLSATSQLSLW